MKKLNCEVDKAIKHFKIVKKAKFNKITAEPIKYGGGKLPKRIFRIIVK